MKSFVLALLFSISLGINAQSDLCNCCTAKYGEFDFWIGDWTVTNADGTAAGSNSIIKIQDNCVIQESWTSAKGNFTGTSTNFYNYKTKQWEQIWVDNQGQSLHLKGNRTGNQMILQSDEEKNKDGNVFYHRITWTIKDDGTVRQFWETFTKNKPVAVAFDGLYKKVN